MPTVIVGSIEDLEERLKKFHQELTDMPINSKFIRRKYKLNECEVLVKGEKPGIEVRVVIHIEGGEISGSLKKALTILKKYMR